MLPLEQPERFMLRRVRQLIDHVDDGMVALVAARRRLVATAATLKRSVGLPLYDHTRESDVALRAQRLGRHLGLESATTDRLFGLLFADAHRVQAPGLDLVAELRADGAPARRRGLCTRFSRAVRLPERESRFLRSLPRSACSRDSAFLPRSARSSRGPAGVCPGQRRARGAGGRARRGRSWRRRPRFGGRSGSRGCMPGGSREPLR